MIIVLYSNPLGLVDSQRPNGSAAMSDGGTQSSSNAMSSEFSEAGLELSLASKDVIKGDTIKLHITTNRIRKL